MWIGRQCFVVVFLVGKMVGRAMFLSSWLRKWVFTYHKILNMGANKCGDIHIDLCCFVVLAGCNLSVTFSSSCKENERANTEQCLMMAKVKSENSTRSCKWFLPLEWSYRYIPSLGLTWVNEATTDGEDDGHLNGTETKRLLEISAMSDWFTHGLMGSKYSCKCASK